MDTKITILATKEDIAKLSGEIASNKAEIGNSKADLLKWMFVFWASQLVAMFGFVLLYLKK